MRLMILGKATAVSEAGVLLDCFRETASAHHRNLGAGGAA